MNLDIEKIIREYIDKTIHMSLGTSRDNKPWVCEVHFGYDQSLNLYFVSLPETRHCSEITVNPQVAGNIVKQHDLTESPKGIYFEGTATVLDAPTTEEIESYCTRLNRDIAELSEKLSEAGGHRMYKIAVENWYAFGKFGTEKNAKHELAWNGGKR